MFLIQLPLAHENAVLWELWYVVGNAIKPSSQTWRCKKPSAFCYTPFPCLSRRQHVFVVCILSNVAQQVFSCLLIIYHFQFEWSHISVDEEKLPLTTFIPGWDSILKQPPSLVLVSVLVAKRPLEMHPQKGSPWSATLRSRLSCTGDKKQWRVLAWVWEKRGLIWDLYFSALNFLHNDNWVKCHWFRALSRPDILWLKAGLCLSFVITFIEQLHVLNP